jgi:hypothetical protein
VRRNAYTTNELHSLLFSATSGRISKLSWTVKEKIVCKGWYGMYNIVVDTSVFLLAVVYSVEKIDHLKSGYFNWKRLSIEKKRAILAPLAC